MATIVTKPESLGLERRRAARIVDTKALILGSIVEMVHTCGKPGCRCADGLKHVSIYLAVRRKRKRVMISIPRSMEQEVRSAVETYKQLTTTLERISARKVNEIILKKKKGD